MKRHYLYILLFISYLTVNGQNSDTITLIKDSISSLEQEYKYQEAILYINQQEESKDLLIEKARFYRELGEYYQASKILKELLRNNENDKEILFDLATIYELSNDWKSAKECYAKLEDSDSTNIYFKIRKTDMQYYLREYEQAIEAYKTIYEKNKTSGILKKIGKCFDNLNMPDSAQYYYARAWDYDILDTEAAVYYINASINLKEYSYAIAACEAYRQKDSTNNHINSLYALNHYILEQYKPAVEILEKCIANGDSSLLVNRTIGFCHYFQKNDSLSYEYLSKAFVQDTTNNNVIYCLGMVCNNLSKSEEAIKYFTTLLDRTVPKDETLYRYYRGSGTAYGLNNQFENSVKHYSKAMEYGDDNQKAILENTIAEIYYYHLDDRENGLKFYEKYAESLARYLAKLKAEKNPQKEDIHEAEMQLRVANKKIERLSNR